MAEIKHLHEKPEPDALLPGNLRVSVRLAGDELLTDGLAKDVLSVYRQFLDVKTALLKAGYGQITSGEVGETDPQRLAEALGLSEPRPFNGPPLRDWGAENDEE